jgi:MFS family permease
VRAPALAAPTLWPDRLATAGVFLGNGLGIGAWAAAIPVLQQRLALSNGALSLALLAFAVGAVVAMPVAGLLAPRLGTARASRWAGAAFAMSLLAPAMATSLPALAAAAFVVGACNGLLDVAMNAHAAGIERRWGAAIMSSFHAAFSLGGLAGTALGGLCVALSGGSALVPTAVLALATTAAACVALREDTAPHTGASGLALPGRAVLPLCAAALLCMLCEGAMADWSGVYLATTTGVGAGAAASGYAAFSAAMLAGRFAGDAAVRRLGRPRVVALGGALAAAGLALAVGWPAPVPAGIGFALVGLGLSNVVPAVFSAAARLAATPAAGMAMAATAGYAGFLVGPVLIGATAEAVGLRVAIGLLAACAAAVALLGGALRRAG